MNVESLEKYCKSKVHQLFLNNENIKDIIIVPSYNRDKIISVTEKQDKLFNYKRPTAEIKDGLGYLYVFPGKAYIEHYANIYRHQGYNVTVKPFTEDDIRNSVKEIFPKEFPKVNTIILGYVEPLADVGKWEGNEEIAWKIQSISGALIAFVGVKFSYWGDIIYYVTEILADNADQIIYIGKLWSLNQSDIPNKTIASGNSSCVEGQEVIWKNIFDENPIVSYGKHVTLPSVLDETHEWFLNNRHQYRFVDPEIGWAAKACQINNVKFSYLHLVTDNLYGNFLENLANEREKKVIEKRLQYVGIIKSILWHTLAKKKMYPYCLLF